MSKDLEDYPTEREDGKVKNPLTGNFVTQSYAKKKDLLEQAKQHTQEHFRDQDDTEKEESEEIDELLQEAENVDPGEAFSLDDEEGEKEKLDEHAEINHPEVPDSEFPNEEDFADSDFEQPPTPEGLDQAAKSQQGTGEEYQGIYSSRNASQPASQGQTKSLEEKHEQNNVRYVRTEHGGMKIVHLDENDD